MNFTEAVELKERNLPNKDIKGFENFIFVTPKDEEDFAKYFKHFSQQMPSSITDGTATLYCTNNIYTARIFRLNDTVIVTEDLD